MDLRWQKPSMDNGFYGLEDSVLMRTTEDPNHKIDWGDMAAGYRSKKDTREVNS